MTRCVAFTPKGETCSNTAVSNGLCTSHSAEKQENTKAYALAQLEFKQRGDYATLDQQLKNLLSTFRTLPINEKLREVEKAYAWHEKERHRLDNENSIERSKLN